MGSSRGTLFFLVPVSACLPPTTLYAHCTRDVSNAKISRSTDVDAYANICA